MGRRLQGSVGEGPGVCTVLVGELAAVGVGDVHHELLPGHRGPEEGHPGQEVVHVVHHIRILIDIHRVFVKLKAAPELAHLSALDSELVVEFPAHHHNVRGLGKVFLAHGALRLVQSVAQAVSEVVAELPLDFQAQLFGTEGTGEVAAGCRFLKAGSIV